MLNLFVILEYIIDQIIMIVFQCGFAEESYFTLCVIATFAISMWLIINPEMIREHRLIYLNLVVNELVAIDCVVCLFGSYVTNSFPVIIFGIKSVVLLLLESWLFGHLLGTMVRKIKRKKKRKHGKAY